MSDIFGRLAAILIDDRLVEPEAVRPDATCENLRLDSLDEIALVHDIERAFCVVIPDDIEFETLSDIVAFVEAQRKAA